MIVQIDPKVIVYNEYIQTLCYKKYKGHSHGCPNYGKKQGCPPNQPLINKILDFNKPIFIIYIDFNLEDWVKKIRRKHSDWSYAQCANPRYWQPRARKFLREEERKAIKMNGLTQVVWPESYGVNVDELMKSIDINLEWPPKNITRLIRLGGHYS